MAPPGMPKMSVVPAASSDLIKLCAPVTRAPVAVPLTGLPCSLMSVASCLVVRFQYMKKPLGRLGNEG
jgi:hypothetical protein